MTAAAPPPPGDRGEQLPEYLLTLVTPFVGAYLSTACQTAKACTAAARVPHGRHLETELGFTAARLHTRCRRTQKFTGQACDCDCHGEPDTPPAVDEYGHRDPCGGCAAPGCGPPDAASCPGFDPGELCVRCGDAQRWHPASAPLRCSQCGEPDTVMRINFGHREHIHAGPPITAPASVPAADSGLRDRVLSTIGIDLDQDPDVDTVLTAVCTGLDQLRTRAEQAEAALARVAAIAADLDAAADACRPGTERQLAAANMRRTAQKLRDAISKETRT